MLKKIPVAWVLLTRADAKGSLKEGRSPSTQFSFSTKDRSDRGFSAPWAELGAGRWEAPSYYLY